MGNEKANNNKFTWVIKNFYSLQSQFIYSDKFVVGGCKWCLMAYPKGNKGDECLSLYMVVAGHKALPCGWRRHAKYSLTVVNQLSEKLSLVKDRQVWFDHKIPGWGLPAMLPLTVLNDKHGGFLVNNQVKIVAQVEVLQVLGKYDVLSEGTAETVQPLKKIMLEEPKETIQPLKKIKLEEPKETIQPLLKETKALMSMGFKFFLHRLKL
ncbi:hypothetical protein AALP_AA2G066700 [Arabis alpina]|uniref:MATH domain-containing protein n=1 Tax=Arabis alpina TaxID=50452 RepID=A0A087HFQ7_ARAAL|nr:hypothetical protein AALP_AA2G066700 [Arabis alpina]